MAKKRSTKRRAPARRRRKATVSRAPARRSRKAPARRRRSNPRGLMTQPAFKFGIAAVGGAIAASLVNNSAGLAGPLAPLTMGGKIQPATVAAILTIGIGWKFAKGKTKGTLIAAGAGMLVPQAVSTFQGFGQAGGSTASALRAPSFRQTLRAPAPKSSTVAAVQKMNRDLMSV